MSTSTERIIIALAFGVALVNFLFMGIGLLYYVCLVVTFVVCGSSVLRWALQRRPISRH
jgi:general stress protein CsbA